jgi:hypothetical protein
MLRTIDLPLFIKLNGSLDIGMLFFAFILRIFGVKIAVELLMRSCTSKIGGRGIAGENSILLAILNVTSDGLGSCLCAIDEST